MFNIQLTASEQASILQRFSFAVEYLQHLTDMTSTGIVLGLKSADNASEEAIDGLNNLSTDRPSSADNESHFILNDLDVQDNRCTMDIQDNRPSLYSLVHVKKEIDRFHQPPDVSSTEDSTVQLLHSCLKPHCTKVTDSTASDLEPNNMINQQMNSTLQLQTEDVDGRDNTYSCKDDSDILCGSKVIIADILACLTMDYCHEHPVYIQPKYVGGPPIASVIISGKTHIEVQIDHNPEYVEDPSQGASNVEQGEADEVLNLENEYVEDPSQSASGVELGEADDVQVDHNPEKEYVEGPSSGVEQGEADEMDHNSEKEYVGGSSQSASGVEQGDSEAVEMHNSEKSERDGGNFKILMMMTTLVMGILRMDFKYPAPCLKLSRTNILLFFFISCLSNTTLATASSGSARLTLTGDRVSYPGGRAAYSCARGGTIVGVQWLVNGTRVEDLNLGDGVVVEFSRAREEGNLVFGNIPAEYNETTIQCRVNYSSGTNSTSNTITLLLQGMLSVVGNPSAIVLGSTISLTWEAPFFFDIIGDDVTYRVDVINSTSSQVIHSQGGINITQYNYTTSLSPERRACDIFKFIITPVNVVGNGNESSISQGYLNHVPTVLSHDAFQMEKGPFSFRIMMSDVVCDVTILEISTIYYNEIVETSGINAIVDGSIVEVTGNLTLNRLYNVTIMVSASGRSRTIHRILSTHDVQRTEMDDTSINITYVKNTTAKGVLCALLFFRNRRMDFNSSVYIVLDVRNRTLELPYLSRGRYVVLSYDVESTGILEPGYPAYIDTAESRMDQGSTPSPRSSELENCNVTHSNGSITASCEYPQNSTASGFQISLQFSDPENMESVYELMVGQTLNHSTSVSINVKRSGTYCVVLFAIINGVMDQGPSFLKQLEVKADQGSAVSTPSTSTSTPTPPREKKSVIEWAIPLSILLFLVIFVVIFLVIIMMVKIRKWKNIHHRFFSQQ